MRSLYTADIDGSQSKPTILDKKYYKQQHDIQIQRSPRNPEKKFQYEWYVPVPQPEKPTYERQPQRNTIKLMSEHTGLSRSVHYESLKKGNSKYETNLPHHENYSLLSQSALNNINHRSRISQSVNTSQDPYYPHKIRDKYDSSYSTRFTGNRQWNYTEKSQIKLPNPRSQYVSRWNQL